MLQQTQVATVVPYYLSWMKRFPTIEALGRAREDQVLKAWEGLGYYSRARRLHAGARRVIERFGGEVPTTVDELRSLPGVGDYSAGAIASIAFGRRAPVVDGNVIRVLCRQFGLDGDPNKAATKRTLWAVAEALIPTARRATSTRR